MSLQIIKNRPYIILFALILIFICYYYSPIFFQPNTYILNDHGDAIKNYDEVLIFGPTHAKEELVNLLKADRHFENIKIDVKHADKMTENQQHAFVKDYFIKE